MIPVKTTINGLPIYEDNDPQDLREGYNRAMIILDKFLSRTEQSIKELKEREDNGD